MITADDLAKRLENIDAAEVFAERGFQGFVDAMIGVAVDALLDQYFNTPDMQAQSRAYVRFGQRVNRSNRHKWRRCYLLEKQLGAPVTQKDLPHEPS